VGRVSGRASVAVIAGVLAAIMPARRAAKLNVLRRRGVAPELTR
jgi:ABC-type antimicrobial peptide transport system permease subunit